MNVEGEINALLRRVDELERAAEKDAGLRQKIFDEVKSTRKMMEAINKEILG